MSAETLLAVSLQLDDSDNLVHNHLGMRRQAGEFLTLYVPSLAAIVVFEEQVQ